VLSTPLLYFFTSFVLLCNSRIIYKSSPEEPLFIIEPFVCLFLAFRRIGTEPEYHERNQMSAIIIVANSDLPKTTVFSSQFEPFTESKLSVPRPYRHVIMKYGGSAD
jgi:hypothetical protein